MMREDATAPSRWPERLLVSPNFIIFIHLQRFFLQTIIQTFTVEELFGMRLKTLMMTTVVFALFAGIIGCGGATVAEIAGEKISIEEFEQVYAKNNGGWDAAAKTSVEDRQKFLDLYVKFRLKVKEAYARGYDKDKELQNELNDYRKNLAVSYMLEKEITKPALEKLYQRKQKEIRASHILVGSGSDNPVDTLINFNYAKQIIDSMVFGIPFETLALHNSEDPSVQYNKGDLYYFSAGSMVPEFEDAVYGMQKGEVTKYPIRTQFGYHIIKVTDILPNQGPVHVSHIMKRLNPNDSPEDSIRAMQELTTYRDSILAGKDFGMVARMISDDTFSGGRGGDLGFIDRGRTVREFDDLIFSMKDSSVSPVIRTQFGLHIVKRHSAKGFLPFEQMEQQLKSEYQNYRFQYDQNRMIVKIKKEYNYTENEKNIGLFASSVDTTKSTTDATWDSTLTPAVRSAAIYSYGGKNVPLDSVIHLAKMNPELNNLSFASPNTVPLIVQKIGVSLITEFHAQQLQSKFPDFSRTMKEYEEGILLFKAEQEQVWNKVQPNDSTLRLYHAANNGKYTWPDRINTQEIFVPTDSVAKLVQRALTGYTVDSLVAVKKKSKAKKQTFDTLKIAVAPITFDSAAARFNTRGTTLETRGVLGFLPVTHNDLTKRAWSMYEKDSATYFPNEGGFSFVKVIKKDPAREKTFEEAQSEVSGAFQEFETKRLGDEWYESLKKKYPVVINTEAVGKTFVGAPAAAKK
jgi:peptidyl-prolyl cis-trans isomerase SurA